jgi:hypothetical protein
VRLRSFAPRATRALSQSGNGCFSRDKQLRFGMRDTMRRIAPGAEHLVALVPEN